jgi:hypothetical protein
VFAYIEELPLYGAFDVSVQSTHITGVDAAITVDIRTDKIIGIR